MVCPSASYHRSGNPNRVLSSRRWAGTRNSFVEIDDLMAVRENDPLEPIDFGVDVGGTDSHTLLVLDVTGPSGTRFAVGNWHCPTVGL